jgi:hypothetical protein
VWYAAVAMTAFLSVVGDACSGSHNLFSDDAFYYLVTARNFLSQGFFTFDGAHPTNGFHPLWMYVVVGIYGLLPADASLSAQIVAVKLTQIAIILVAIASAAFMAHRLHERGSAYAYGFAGAVLIMVYPEGSPSFRSGMETTLATLIAIWVAYALVHDNRRAVGLLLPLLFLSRLDLLVYFAGPVALYFLLRRDLGWPARLAPTAPVAAVAGAFTLYNYATYGYAAPISGVLKSSFPWPTPQLSFLLDPIMYARYSVRGVKYFTLPNLTSIAALSTLAMVTLGVLVRRQRGRLRLLDLLFAAFPLALVVGIVMFQKWSKQVANWYLDLAMVTGAFATMLALARSLERLGGAPRALGAAILLCLILFSGIHVWWLPRTLQQDHIGHDSSLYAFLRDGTGPEAVLAGSDVGRVAFWSGRRTINLDGLINSYDYQDYLRDGRLLAYLNQEGVTHLILAVWSERPRYVLRDLEKMYEFRVNPDAVDGPPYEIGFYLYSYMYGVYSDRITLTPEREVFRGKIRHESMNDGRWLVFDVRDLSVDAARAE